MVTAMLAPVFLVLAVLLLPLASSINGAAYGYAPAEPGSEPSHLRGTGLSAGSFDKVKRQAVAREQSTTKAFTLSDGRLPSQYIINGTATVVRSTTNSSSSGSDGYVLRLGGHDSSSSSAGTHVFAPISRLLGVPPGQGVSRVSMSLKLQARCRKHGNTNEGEQCKLGQVLFMLYAPQDAATPLSHHPDSSDVTGTGLTARVDFGTKTDEVFLQGRRANSTRVASGQLETSNKWFPMTISWDKTHGLGYSSATTNCTGSCIQDKSKKADGLHLPPTTDWVFRISTFLVKGYDMQVDVSGMEVRATWFPDQTLPTPAPTAVATPAPTPVITAAPTPAPTIAPLEAMCMRVRVIANRGHVNDLAWSEFWFMRTDGSFVDAVDVTATGWWPDNSGTAPWNAQDLQLDTNYYNGDAMTSSWTVSFASPQAVAGYAWATSDLAPSIDPTAWAIDFSSDCSDWTLAYDVRAHQDITEKRRTWAGTWWFHSSCYVANFPAPPPQEVQSQCVRIRVLETRGAPDLQFSEWWFLAPNGKRLVPSDITATGSWPTGGNGNPANAADGDFASNYYNQRALTSALTMKYETPQAVSGYWWSTASDQPEKDPQRWAIDVSPNCQSWVSGYDVTRSAQSVTTTRYTFAGTWWFPFTPACAHSPTCRGCGPAPTPAPKKVEALSVRVRVLATKGSASDVQFAEWRFLSPNGNFLHPASVTATGAWPDYLNVQPSYGADNDFSTKYYNTYALGSSFTTTFLTPTVVAGYQFATADDHPERDPTAWAIDYSVDGVEWVSGFDVRTKQHVTDSRYMWAGTYMFSSSCYLDHTLPGCCNCV